MTHLKIIQNNTLADTEEVSQEIIQKLYDLAVSGDLDASSEMKGRLHLTQGYRTQTEYLHQMFPNLIISADTYIIPFEDPKMVTYLNSIGVGSNGVITEADAAAATVVANSQNTEVTKFNELKYFTSITESKGGPSGSSLGWVLFYDWTALEEVDISNFTSIGHISPYAWGDTFSGCTSLKKVTASDKLEVLGHRAFYNCSNLEEITNLNSNTITVRYGAFYNCQKLKTSTFANCEIFLPVAAPAQDSDYLFYNTKALTSITLSPQNTHIPKACFYSSGLTSINIPSGVTEIREEAFRRCTNLTSVTLPASVTSIGPDCFSGCTLLANIDLSHLTFIDRFAFSSCSITSADVSNVTNFGGRGVFESCRQLTTVTLSNSLTALPLQMFINCSSLTTVNLNNITTFGSEAFSGCTALQLTSQDISQAEVINSGAFTSTNLTGDLVLPHLTMIDWQAFRSTKITSVDFTGSTFTKINDSTFLFVSTLDHVILPSTVTQVGSMVFYNCSNLRYVVFPTTSTITWGDQVFINVLSTCIIYVDDSKVSEVTAALSGKFNGQIKGISEMPTT